MNFCYAMTFLQCVHGVYDEKMEAVYRKSSRKGSFEEDTESTFYSPKVIIAYSYIM